MQMTRRMARLSQLFEYLFENPGSTLVLDSETAGSFQKDGKARPVFRSNLSTGQILLLFADLVPNALSAKLLSGVPVEFPHRIPQGTVQVHMTLSGDDLRVTVRPLKKTPSLVPVAPQLALGPPPPDQPMKPTLAGLLKEMEARRATHLHLTPGRAALLRYDGNLVPVPGAVFDAAQLGAELEAFAPPSIKTSLQDTRVDFTHLTENAVFHVSVQRSDNGLTLVVRHRPRSVSIASLGLPPELAQAMVSGGLWVIAGPAGHGVSTSLAAVMQAIVERPLSVRCLESPIEYMLTPGEGPLSQLEIGVHAASFTEGLRGALRDDVDVVMVSRLDDVDVMRAALDLAARGKLVVCGVHARGSVQAAEELYHLTGGSPVARWQLGQAFRGVFAQVLCRNKDGGRSLAWELLPGLPSVRQALGEGQLAALNGLRTHSLEQSLAELVTLGTVSRDDALALAPDRAAIDRLLARTGSPSAGRTAA